MTENTYSEFDFDYDDFLPPHEPEAPAEADTGPALPFALGGVDLLSPPGFVGQVTDWIDAQCRYPRRRLAVAAALVSLGNIGGLRHVDLDYEITANLMTFCVAASATGKERILEATQQLMGAAGMSRVMHGGIKSEQEITRNLIEHQAACYVVDEIGIFLTKVRNAQNRGGATYLEGVFGALMSIYSKAAGRYLLSGDVRRDLRKVYSQMLSACQKEGDEDGATSAKRMLDMVDQGLHRPFLSVIGFTTPSTFDETIDGANAEQGFIGRALIIHEHDINPAPRANFTRAQMPEQMQLRLAALAHGGVMDAMKRQSARVEWTGDLEPIGTESDAHVMIREAMDWSIAYASFMDENTGGASVAMVRRMIEQMLKVSLILAIPHGVRTADHVRWAFAYCRAELDAKVRDVFANDNATARPDEALAARILRYLGEDGLSVKTLSNRMKTKPDKLEAILKRLEASGDVAQTPGKRKVKGWPITIWRATKG